VCGMALCVQAVRGRLSTSVRCVVYWTGPGIGRHSRMRMRWLRKSYVLLISRLYKYPFLRPLPLPILSLSFFSPSPFLSLSISLPLPFSPSPLPCSHTTYNIPHTAYNIPLTLLLSPFSSLLSPSSSLISLFSSLLSPLSSLSPRPSLHGTGVYQLHLTSAPSVSSPLLLLLLAHSFPNHAIVRPLVRRQKNHKLRQAKQAQLEIHERRGRQARWGFASEVSMKIGTPGVENGKLKKK